MENAMRETLRATAFVALLAMIFPGSADARMICGERDSIIEKLRHAHGERRRVEALTDAGTLMEVFVSPAGTWTIRITAPGGPSCLVSSGEGWRPVVQADGEA